MQTNITSIPCRHFVEQLTCHPTSTQSIDPIHPTSIPFTGISSHLARRDVGVGSVASAAGWHRRLCGVGGRVASSDGWRRRPGRRRRWASSDGWRRWLGVGAASAGMGVVVGRRCGVGGDGRRGTRGWAARRGPAAMGGHRSGWGGLEAGGREGAERERDGRRRTAA